MPRLRSRSYRALKLSLATSAVPFTAGPMPVWRGVRAAARGVVDEGRGGRGEDEHCAFVRGGPMGGEKGPDLGRVIVWVARPPRRHAGQGRGVRYVRLRSNPGQVEQRGRAV